jgi:lipopolysaccharide heptosyltransferase III
MIKPRNLLIVRTDRIGDVVLTLPLAEIIKNYFQDCKITFLIREYTKSIVEGNPFIDEVLILKENKGRPLIRENVKEISKKHFDSCVIVYPTFSLALIIYLTRIINIVGTGYRWYSFFFNHKVFQHRKYAEMHELEFNIKLLEVFGIKEKPCKKNVNFNLIVKEKQKVNEFIKSTVKGNKKLVVIHPGSGGSAVDLPVEKFKELVLMLNERNDIEIIITGSDSESKLCESLIISEKVHNLAGKLNLGELISLINKADIFISNSTGPLHIAAALGKNIIGFYPNLLQCSAKRWGPYSDKSVVFMPRNECSDCEKEQCYKTECMNSIDMQNVYSVILDKLNLS